MIEKKFEQFRALHAGDRPLVVGNPWDAGSAKLLTQLGFRALATTSAGFGFSIGEPSSSGRLTREAVITNCREIVAATPLPVTADLEDGFGQAPEDCATTITAAIAVGLVGGSIEDATGNPGAPIFDFDLTVRRVEAAVQAAKDHPFMVTARAEGLCYGKSDLGEIIDRLQAFDAVGADVLYAPGLTHLDDIARVCTAVTKPVNVVMGLSGLHATVDQLADVGVKRISVGGSFLRAGLGAIVNAATEVLDDGTFSYQNAAYSDSALSALLAKDPTA